MLTGPVKISELTPGRDNSHFFASQELIAYQYDSIGILKKTLLIVGTFYYTW